MTTADCAITVDAVSASVNRVRAITVRAVYCIPGFRDPGSGIPDPGRDLWQNPLRRRRP